MLTLRKKILWRDPCEPFFIVLTPAKRISPRTRLIERFLMSEDKKWSGLSWEKDDGAGVELVRSMR